MSEILKKLNSIEKQRIIDRSLKEFYDWYNNLRDYERKALILTKTKVFQVCNLNSDNAEIVFKALEEEGLLFVNKDKKLVEKSSDIKEKKIEPKTFKIEKFFLNPVDNDNYREQLKKEKELNFLKNVEENRERLRKALQEQIEKQKKIVLKNNKDLF